MPLQRTTYRFEDAVLDVSNQQLAVEGQPRPVEPKSFRVLQYLVENRGRVITKDELLRSVWAETHVTENALTRAVTQLRKALADDAKQPRYIETVPTIGYRFVAAVAEDGPALVDSVPSVPDVTPSSSGPRLRWLGLGSALVLLIFAAVAAGRWNQGRPPPQFQSRQFTTGAGLEVSATFSPDGNLLAYASDRSGSFQIYVRSVEPGSREVKVTNLDGQCLYPTFSPDGRVLAFSKLDQPGIFRVPSLGGPVHRLTQFGVQPSWSPDGKRIVFRSDMARSLATTDLYFRPSTSLWLMNADGSDLREITSVKAPGGGHAFASWSADSAEIRFARYEAYVCEMWAYRLSNGSLRRLFASTNRGGFGSAIFSRDDRSMFYLTSELNGDIGIWEQGLNPRTLTPDSSPHLLYRPSVGVPRDLALSRDGSQLAYSATLSDSRIRMFNLIGDEPAGEPVDLTHEVNFRFTQPRWSADGKLLAFTSLQKARPPRIQWLAYPEGEAREVQPGQKAQFSPMFANQGSAMLYVAGTGEIFRTELPDGLTTVLRKLPPDCAQPSLAPSGTELVFNRIINGVINIWKMDLRSGDLKQLTFGKGVTGYPVYSNDGRWIAFERQTPGKSNLAIMPADGPEPQEDFAVGIFYPFSWSPDNSKIAYAGLENGVWNLYWISREQREARLLTQNKNARIYFRYPHWSRDGKMAFEFNETKGNVYIADLR